MSIISERQARQLSALFVAQARERVTITLFTRQANPGAATPDPIMRACDDARALLAEVVALAPDYLALEIRDLATDAAEAWSLGIERVPAIVLRGPVAGRARTFGAPTDYEFTTLIDDLLDLVAGGHTGLSEASRAALALLRRPVHLQVFAAPT
jgi:hypothetical protein